MSRKDWLVVVGVVLSAVFVVACGGSGGKGGSGEQASKAEVEEAQLEFAQCMREHGVDVPDPTNGGGIVLKQSARGGPGEKDAGGSSPQIEAANEACEHLIKDVIPEPSPGQREEMKEQLLEFAQCMREHGIDMPDPTFEGAGKVKMSIKGPRGGSPNDPLMKKAQEACQSDGNGPMMFRAGP